MQKALELALLINSLYKKLISALFTRLYNPNKVNFPLKIIFKDTNKPKLTIIKKIRKSYIKDKIVQKIIQVNVNNF